MGERTKDTTHCEWAVKKTKVGVGVEVREEVMKKMKEMKEMMKMKNAAAVAAECALLLG
jgi:hypothetical protein